MLKFAGRPLRILEAAWAAGFFEGEGTSGVQKKSVRLQLSQSDREPLDKMVSYLGGCVYGPYGPYSSQSKSYFLWHIYAKEAAEAMRRMSPYLTNRRRLQWEAAVIKSGLAG